MAAASGKTRGEGWVWYGDFAAPDAVSGNGTAYVVSSNDRQVVVPVRRLIVGFGKPDVGEAAWTARDLA